MAGKSPTALHLRKAGINKCSQFIHVDKNKFGEYANYPIGMEPLSVALMVCTRFLTNSNYLRRNGGGHHFETTTLSSKSLLLASFSSRSPLGTVNSLSLELVGELYVTTRFDLSVKSSSCLLVNSYGFDLSVVSMTLVSFC